MKNNSMIKMIVCLFFFVIPVLILTGCGHIEERAESFYEKEEPFPSYESSVSEKTDKIYRDAADRLSDMENLEEMEGKDIFDKLARKLLRGFRKSYRMFRALSPLICICSICFGILLMILSTHNKRLKRMGLYAFIIGIPCIVLLFVFGIGIFNGIILN